MSRDPEWRNFQTEGQGKVYQGYSRLYDSIDALSAIAFIIGSALFFSESTQREATWLFLVGSVFFAVRPLVHVVRDFHLARVPVPGDEGGEGET